MRSNSQNFNLLLNPSKINIMTSARPVSKPLIHQFVIHFLKRCSYVSQAERRRKLGLPPGDPDAAKPSAPIVEEKKV